MSASQVIAAIHALYKSDDSSVKKEADRWLEHWQSSTEAWTVANSILHDPASDPEYTYFCAQTLKTKVQRDYEELPADAVQQLRDSLLQLLFKFGSGSPAVRTQLCLAMAALAAHLPAAQWGDGGVLKWLLDRFNGQEPNMAMSCMLELLTVLPQEADSRKISCRPERRAAFASELKASIPDALNLLTSCLQQSGETVRSQVLESLGCWLKLSEGNNLPPGMPDSPLVKAALDGLKVDGTFHAAVDAVVELIWVTVDPVTSVPNPAMTGLAQHLVIQVMALRPRFSVALRKAIAEYEGRDGGDDDVDDEFDDDDEAVKGMARLFCEMSEAYIQLILSATPQVLPPVEALLDVCAHPEQDIYSMSFGFWGKLSRQLRWSSSELQQQQQQQQQAMAPPGSALPNAQVAPAGSAAVEQQRRREFFRPAFEKLLSLIRGRMRLPEGYSTMRSREKSDWRRLRHAWGDVLRDAAAAIGCTRALQLLVQPLTEMAAPRPFDWKTAELALNCVRCISQLPHPHPEPNLQQLIAALPTMPSSLPPQLQYTAALMLSAYAEWLGVETAAGRCVQLLPPLLSMLLTALNDNTSAQAAAIAVRDLCECCGSQMQPCLQDLLLLYTKTLEAGSASRAAAAAAAAAAAGSQGVIGGPLLTAAQRQAVGAVAAAASDAAAAAVGGLHEEDVLCVIQGVVSCFIKCVPPNQLPVGLQTLAQPLLNPIKAAMQQFSPSLASGDTALAAQLPLFDRLATMFDCMEQHHQAAAGMLQQVWPSLDAAMQRAGQDASSVERLCRVLRYGIKASNKACAPMLPTLLDRLPTRFQQTGHPAFMYVVSEMLKVFASEPAADVSMTPILSALLTSSCHRLTTLEQMDQAPDLMDDTFLLAGRAAAYAPRMLLHEPLLPQLLDTAMLGVLVQHREACRSVLSFLTRLLDPSYALAKLQEQQQQRQIAAGTALDTSATALALLQAQLDRVGSGLSRLLMGGVVGALPRSRGEDIAPVLQAMLRLGREKALQWLRDCLAAIPDIGLTASDRDAFMAAAAAVLAGNAGMDGGCEGLEEALEAVSDLCRRNKRASRAAQSALLPVQLHAALGLVSVPGA